MSKFKDFANSDISQVFFSLEEFGENHVVGGNECVCVIDSDVKNGSVKLDDYYFNVDLVLLVSYKELGYKPAVNNTIKVDDKLYVVLECKETVGVLEIKLGKSGEW